MANKPNKTIEDYKRDYAAAKATGDAAGMKAANDGANAIRASQGQAAQVANEDIAKVAAASKGTSGGVSYGGTSYGGTTGSGKSYGYDDYGQTDYSVLLKDAMNAGAGAQTVEDLLGKRLDKAQSNGYYQYMYDDVYEQAMKYIREQQAQQVPQYAGDRYDTDDIISQLTSMSYDDWTKGEQYQALLDRYGIQGKMSMQDVLGQISSRTGGLASSYATTAAQQQYNEYMSQLEEVARQMYASDRDDLMDNYKLMADANDTQYDRYLDSLNQYYTQRQYNDNQSATDKADAQDRVNAYLAAYGDAGNLDAELLEQSGYTQTELSALQSYYAAQKAQEEAAASAKSSASGSSGSTGGTTKPRLTAAQTLSALENGVVNDTTRAAYEYYFGQPWQTEAETATAEAAGTAAGSGYDQLSRELLRLEDTGLSDAAKANKILNLIEQYMTRGSITESQALALLRQYGLN